MGNTNASEEEFKKSWMDALVGNLDGSKNKEQHDEYIKRTVGEIINVPFEEMKNHGDAVTYHNHTNTEWVRGQLTQEWNDQTFLCFNSTSLGNLARIADGCPDEELKKKALEGVNAYVLWWKEKYGEGPDPLCQCGCGKYKFEHTQSEGGTSYNDGHP